VRVEIHFKVNYQTKASGALDAVLFLELRVARFHGERAEVLTCCAERLNEEEAVNFGRKHVSHGAPRIFWIAMDDYIGNPSAPLEAPLYRGMT